MHHRKITALPVVSNRCICHSTHIAAPRTPLSTGDDLLRHPHIVHSFTLVDNIDRSHECNHSLSHVFLRIEKSHRRGKLSESVGTCVARLGEHLLDARSKLCTRHRPSVRSTVRPTELTNLFCPVSSCLRPSHHQHVRSNNPFAPRNGRLDRLDRRPSTRSTWTYGH
ncbi:BZ3500_MvSof-1268-A1-R1_Chr11-1g03118 [Microbotryum saponariae]|uniref:BZ3500_MvSof-1268-A1-R1_Chr11-1g03118 protein n=1 Tax=Microbotryum saponariae TaxID=289078 RepID=A0A2X0L7K2_9BASI|nr:BZ3501_MvSof-1269-A2-R1_Chr11g02693 [Microbotryum saponariae]SDA03678.1 BZ3500_MvSof-1268-A1-R1_Chr11-1g03118 [Microbotryum saponariae]